MERHERSNLALDAHDPETELELVRRDLVRGDIGLCKLVLDSLFYCTSPRHQLRTYYFEGKFDGCKLLAEAARYCAKQSVQGGSDEPWRDQQAPLQEQVKEKPPWKFKERYYELNREKIRRRYDLGDDPEGTGGTFSEASTP